MSLDFSFDGFQSKGPIEESGFKGNLDISKFFLFILKVFQSKLNLYSIDPRKSRYNQNKKYNTCLGKPVTSLFYDPFIQNFI